MGTLTEISDLEPDLSRDAGDGTIVECYFLPDLANAEKAIIRILIADKKVVLDLFEVPVKEAYEAWRHTTLRSEPYARSLT